MSSNSSAGRSLEEIEAWMATPEFISRVQFIRDVRRAGGPMPTWEQMETVLDVPAHILKNIWDFAGYAACGRNGETLQ